MNSLLRIGRPSGSVELGRALLATSGIAGAVARLVAVTLLHGFRQALRALAQRVQRAPLRVHRAVGITFAEPAVASPIAELA